MKFIIKLNSVSVHIEFIKMYVSIVHNEINYNPCGHNLFYNNLNRIIIKFKFNMIHL